MDNKDELVYSTAGRENQASSQIPDDTQLGENPDDYKPNGPGRGKYDRNRPPKDPNEQPKKRRQRRNSELITYVNPTLIVPKPEPEPIKTGYEKIAALLPETMYQMLLSEPQDLGFEVAPSDIIVAALEMYFSWDRETRAKYVISSNGTFAEIMAKYMAKGDSETVIKLVNLKQLGKFKYDPKQSEG